MNAIIVDYDPFAMESRVNVIKEGKHEQLGVASSIENLANDLVALTYQYNIYSVKVNAPLATTNEIKRQVNALESTTYSANKIQVEVM